MRRVIDEWLAPFRWPGTLIAWLSLSLIAGLVGPFGTYDLLDLRLRFLLWGGAVAAAMCLGALARAVVHALPGIRSRRWSALVVALAVTVMMTPLCAALIRAVSGTVVRPHTLAEIAATLLFASLAVCAVARGRARLDRTWASPALVPLRPAIGAEPQALPDPLPETAPESPPEPRLLRRLDPPLRGRLVSISVRDHYVDVVTEAGRASLLMRLSDAMAEAEGEDGAQIHRSHWVARHAARALERTGARMVLVLADGTRLPVSRAQRPQIDSWSLAETAADPNTTA